MDLLNIKEELLTNKKPDQQSVWRAEQRRRPDLVQSQRSLH